MVGTFDKGENANGEKKGTQDSCICVRTEDDRVLQRENYGKRHCSFCSA